MFANPTQTILPTTPTPDHTFDGLALLSSVIVVMVTSVSEGRQRLRSDLIPSLLALSSHADSSLSTPATHSIGLLCGGNFSSMEVEGVLSSGIVERLCTRIESESSDVDLLPTLLVLDRLLCRLSDVIEAEKLNTTASKLDQKVNPDSLPRLCGDALARIEKAVLAVKKSVEGQRTPDKKTQEVQKEVGGMILRHFSSSMPSPSRKDIDAIGIESPAARRENEAEREKEKEEFVRKMREMEAERDKEKREMEEMKKTNERLIEKGRQQEEKEKQEKVRDEERKREETKTKEEERKREVERKREDERKKKEEEEEEKRRNVKEGAAAIEVFTQEKYAVAGNVFTKSVKGTYHLLSHSFGHTVVRITLIIRAIQSNYYFGIISTGLTEKAIAGKMWFLNEKGGAGWNCLASVRKSKQNNKDAHKGSACKAGAVGQRVVLEADGREGKRTLKLSQDGETQPVFFSNIPVPFRFLVWAYADNDAVEIVSTEVLKEASMVGGTLEVVVD
ncbi:hypothetical protein BLNAU_12472 [Blattamonas nauphoetae]|uniref:Uncharacterized protein n=1 Tax=Blattamonas nauphoetae TaxID=2049346 RepID=A0ABQ9XPB6_9EUKA|nr:hypothetical protein BLNAU_12472 [Blattamonas nauphoetae]